MKRHLAIALVMVCTAAASAEIVNIDATVNGSPFWGFPQVEVPVTPGHYRATLVSPSLNSAALYTAPRGPTSTATRAHGAPNTGSVSRTDRR